MSSSGDDAIPGPSRDRYDRRGRGAGHLRILDVRDHHGEKPSSATWCARIAHRISLLSDRSSDEGVPFGRAAIASSVGAKTVNRPPDFSVSVRHAVSTAASSGLNFAAMAVSTMRRAPPSASRASSPTARPSRGPAMSASRNRGADRKSPAACSRRSSVTPISSPVVAGASRPATPTASPRSSAAGPCLPIDGWRSRARRNGGSAGREQGRQSEVGVNRSRWRRIAASAARPITSRALRRCSPHRAAGASARRS